MKKRTIQLLAFALLAAPLALTAQSSNFSSSLVAEESSPEGGASHAATAAKSAPASDKPFSRFALGGGISLMGVNMQAATNLNRYLNLRGTGNYFQYTVNNISTNGFSLAGKVNFATGGASLDYYPFPRHGFRLSPGALFYNDNQITASGTGTAGSSIKLNGTKYYTDSFDPLAVNATLGLNTYKQAFTITTGWGNMIPRKGSHWSFPFELGAALTGSPSVNVGLTGWACTNSADVSGNGPSCINMATDTAAQSDLNAQVTKWKSDVNPLKAYPIFSFGLAYAFSTR